LVVCFVQDWRGAWGLAGTAREDIGMRRLFSMAALGFGFYYLWNNTDTTTELVALGAMGVAVVLEFIAPD